MACLGLSLMNKLKIDDPVGCIPTHGFAAIWGILAVALFSEVDNLEKLSTEAGVLKGGRWGLLGVQFLSIVVILVWSGATSFILLSIIDKTIGLRMPLQKELDGADQWEHGIMPDCYSSNADDVVIRRRAPAVEKRQTADTPNLEEL